MESWAGASAVLHIQRGQGRRGGAVRESGGKAGFNGEGVLGLPCKARSFRWGALLLRRKMHRSLAFFFCKNVSSMLNSTQKKKKSMLWITRKGRERKRSLQHYINALVACSFSLVFNSAPSSETWTSKASEKAGADKCRGWCWFSLRQQSWEGWCGALWWGSAVGVAGKEPQGNGGLMQLRGVCSDQTQEMGLLSLELCQSTCRWLQK